MRTVDRLIALVVAAVGVLHIAFGASAFIDPSAQHVWFLSAGLLGLVAGFTNLARASAAPPSFLLSLSAFLGAGSVALIGALLLAAREFRLGADPGVVVLAAGFISAAFAVRDLALALTRRVGADQTAR